MIDYISNKLLNYLVKSDAISNDEDEMAHYKYGIEITISSSLNIILVITLGIIFSRVELSVIFLFLFISIRQLTGGYHASTYFRCNLTMCILYSVCVLMTMMLKNHFNLIFLIVHIIISSLIIMAFCPVSNENKPIKPESRNKYKISSLIISDFFSVLGYLIYNRNKEIGLFIITTIILINALVIISQFTERRKEHEKE